ncbi:hypothetical protein GCM10025734_26440 [Kitasatospora paranensis]
MMTANCAPNGSASTASRPTVGMVSAGSTTVPPPAVVAATAASVSATAKCTSQPAPRPGCGPAAPPKPAACWSSPSAVDRIVYSTPGSPESAERQPNSAR